MRYFKPSISLLILVIGLTHTVSAYAGNLYRYKDENGVTALSLNIPAHLVRNGYEVLGSNGRVIKVVPPALTPEEIAERDAKEAEKTRLAEEAQKQKEDDAALLKLYSHPNDAVRVLNRKLQDIKDFISLKNGNISVVKGQLEQEEAKAANMERTGKKIPDSILNKIAQQKEKIIEIQNDIEVKRNEIPVLNLVFDKIIKRLEFLTKKKADNYPLALPEPATTEALDN
ncbi:hypothetical protein [Alkalimarinus alittae]|uniref:DUF4124 domain-containing protein n=1 Tax=Alkalimarinus alittae TaxID=2961619 RepID=A0ABY6N1R4_9ALTE|nr:hypothetical protein [Alkalimarinus alittae]UZE95932.1 hypothetical protein NKI27_18080 [Alkalimarinus alittae]